MFPAGVIARGPVVAPLLQVVLTSASIEDSDSSANNAVVPVGTALDDWVLQVAAVRWDAAMTFPYWTADQLGVFGNAATGIQLRGAVVPYRYSADIRDGINQIRHEASGISSGLFQALVVVRGAAASSGVSDSALSHGEGGIPTFNSVNTSAGEMVVACTFYSSMSNPNNLGSGWTRAFYDESTIGDDCLLVVDHQISAGGVVTPPSVRSTNLPSSTAWACVAIVVPPA